MGTSARRTAAIGGLAAVAVAVGAIWSNGDRNTPSTSPQVGLVATSEVPAPPTEVKLTGDHNAGTRDSGVVFQQFQGGAIVAKNDDDGTPAYITWGKIREAWNVQRDPAGVPAITGENGSAGPLGVPTSDEIPDGELLVTTFEHGKITYDPRSGQVEVTVDGKVVPSGL